MQPDLRRPKSGDRVLVRTGVLSGEIVETEVLHTYKDSSGRWLTFVRVPGSDRSRGLVDSQFNLNPNSLK